MLHIRFVNFELTVHACYPAVLRFMSVLAQRTATECCKRVDPIAEAIVCRRFTAESRLRVDGSPCEICGVHRGNEHLFVRVLRYYPVSCHSTSAPYAL